ncbi:hypothetical protein SNE40_007390 [Patella caerulea]|uniref:Uncharacterized protein n=1 Tax=Patella caerulea TaxID=87958 RepID=A0AAN8Q877_PATCE
MIVNQLHCLLLASLIVLTVSDDLSHFLPQNDDTNELEAEVNNVPATDKVYESLLSRPASPLLSYLFTKLTPETPQKQEVIKRVFCNGFTGCGGRHRGRRRQHTIRILKRPFCNNWGCGNGKRTLENIVIKPADDQTVRKRLFCNNYGGCRSFKRALYSNWLNKLNGIADNL